MRRSTKGRYSKALSDNHRGEASESVREKRENKAEREAHKKEPESKEKLNCLKNLMEPYDRQRS